jgi:hypothetical protein
MMDAKAVEERIRALLTLRVPANAMNSGDTGDRIGAMFQGAVQLTQLLYGPDAPQVNALMVAHNGLKMRNGATMQIELQPIVVGTLEAMRGDVAMGLVGSVTAKGAGLALGDFLALGKEALSERTEESKNVAAVLTAALFEDTIRRLGELKAGVMGRPKLQEVIDALKDSRVMEGATLTIALGYLKFRNDALHADWAGITPAAVESCIGFVEQLLQQHFG